MRNPINNLGDYNTVIKDLKAADGCLEILYKNIGDAAILKATPKIQLKTGLMCGAITLVTIGVCYFGYKNYQFLKYQKNVKKIEPTLKEDFI